MFRRCVGCRKQRGTTPTAGSGWVCDDCAREWGVFGGRAPNVAEKNSKKYRDEKLCKGGHHNKVKVSRYKSGGRDWEKGVCVRCNAVVYDAVFTG